MAEYTYTGIDKSGQKVTGRVDAPTEGDLRMILRGKGIRPVRIDLTMAKGGGLATLLTGFSKANATVPFEIVIMFTRQLQLLISSGVPLLQGLGILHEQQQNRVFKSIVGEMKDKVSQGAYFWEVLVSYPRIFPKLFVALIRAGESSGSMDSMLKRLTKYMENSQRMIRMLKSAMSYPIIVTAIGGGVIALMLIFVIPKFEEMLSTSGQKLPEVTQFVIDASHFMVNHLMIILASAVGGGYMLKRYVETAEGRAMLDRLTFNAPLFGELIRKSGTARFCRTLNTLLISGVNVVDAIDICRATIDNVVLEEAVTKIRGEIESGQTLGSVLGRLGVFPRMAVEMISVGESTGNLDKMLEKVADFYEDEVEIIVGGMSKLIEPFVLVFLGTTVGGMMIAMYMPIFKLAGGVD